MLLNKIKERCGIAPGITVYDSEILDYIEECKEELIASDVPASVVQQEKKGVITAIALYVKANIGDDRSDTEKYMAMYHKKVFRLTTEVDDICGTDQ
ncbi:hypothetical protein [uncultured Robinsoniella sp.]|uniref:phage head-tail connector protein n=1 Tax=uncultured Robinsoniella sp. TaxID=904190 RepID=UPI002912304B|nr:hypothetical protein [Clostridiales bacterium]